MSNTAITGSTEDLQSPKGLTKLYMSYTAITGLTEDFKGLEELMVLDMDNSTITGTRLAYICILLRVFASDPASNRTPGGGAVEQHAIKTPTPPVACDV